MAPFFHGRHPAEPAGEAMRENVYEVVQDGAAWVLQRNGAVALVEFPTEVQALRAAVAVCRDEGLARLRVRRADGAVRELNPLMQSPETLEA